MTSTLYSVDFERRELLSKSELLIPDFNPRHPSNFFDFEDFPEGA